uniref:Uncharacterized protein n=1 Tax=Anguilla anguilla TaxID=7936 RepID=A0A0E9TK10_ANGAN
MTALPYSPCANNCHLWAVLAHFTLFTMSLKKLIFLNGESPFMHMS